MKIVSTDSNDKNQLISYLRNLIYPIFFEQLRERKLSKFLAFSMVIITYIQLISYYFDEDFNSHMTDQFKSFGKYISYVRLYPLASENTNGTLYLLFCCGIGILVILYCLCVVGVRNALKTNKRGGILVDILNILGLLIFFPLVIPSSELYMDISHCVNGNQHVMTSLECQGGLHIFLIILFLILGLISIILSLIISIFYFESNMFSCDVLGCRCENMEIKFVIFRVILTIVNHFHSSLHGIIIVVLPILYIQMALSYLKTLPHYNKTFQLLIVCGIFCNLWCSLILLGMDSLEYFLGKNYLPGDTMMIVGGFFLCVYYYRFLEDKGINDKTDENDRNISSYQVEWMILNRIRTLENECKLLERKNDGNISSYIETIAKFDSEGYYALHLKECKNSKCVCKYGTEELQSQLFLPLTNEVAKEKNGLDRIFMLHLIKSQLFWIIQSPQLSYCPTLRILLAYFLAFKMGLIYLALEEVYSAEEMDTNEQQKFTLYRFKKTIEESILYKYRSKHTTQKTLENMDVSEVITFQELFNLLNSQIKINCEQHVEFWTELSTISPDLNALHGIGLKILKSNQLIEKTWKSLSKINSKFHKALKLYGWYKRQISNDIEVGNDCIEKANSIIIKEDSHNLNDFDLMFAEDTGIIVINATKGNEGKINWTNSGIPKIFGYNSTEIIGQNVSMLMPSLFAKKHNLFMHQFLQIGIERVVNREREFFGLHRSGFIFQISLVTKQVPSLNDKIQFIGLLRQINKEKDIIITDSRGEITAISQGMSCIFQVQPKMICNNSVFIHFICPELLDFVELKKDSGEKVYTKFDAFQNESIRLKFFFPYNYFKSDLYVLITKQTEIMALQSRTLREDIESENKGNSSDEEAIPAFTDSQKEMHALVDFLGIPPDLEPGTKGKDLLKNRINYRKKQIKKIIHTKIQAKEFGNGELKLKVFHLETQSERNFEGNQSPEKDIEDSLFPRTTSKLPSFELDLEPTVIHQPNNLGKSDLDFLLDAEAKKVDSPNTGRRGTVAGTENTSRKPVRFSSIQNQESKQRRSLFMQKSEEGGKHLRQESDNDLFKKSKQEDFKINLQKATDDEEAIISQNVEATIYPEFPIEDLKTENIIDKLKKFGEDNEELDLNSEQNNLHLEEKRWDLDEDNASSIASTTKDMLNRMKLLKSDSFKKTSSITQLNYTGRSIVVIIGIMSIILYVTIQDLYTYIEGKNDAMLINSERLFSLPMLSKNVRTMVLMNGNESYPQIDQSIRTYSYENIGYSTGGTLNYEEWVRKNIEFYAIDLKQTSTKISLEEFSNSDKINSGDIKVFYNNKAGLSSEFNLDINSALITLSVMAHEIKEYDLEDCSIEDSNIYYILQNSLNSILGKIIESSDTIVENITSKEKEKEKILLTIFIISTFVIAISIGILLPVIYKVKIYHKDILMLFMEIKPKLVAKQIKNCKNFSSSISDDETEIKNPILDQKGTYVTMENELMGLMEESKKEIANYSNEDDKKNDEEDDSFLKKKHKKMYKPFNTKVYSTSIQVLICAALLEFYFGFCYEDSHIYTKNGLQLLEELNYALKVVGTQSLLFSSLLDNMGTYSESTIASVYTVNDFLDIAIESGYQYQEDFVRSHYENEKVSTDSYNSYFSNALHNSLCEMDYVVNQENCESLQNGILKQGFYQSTITFFHSIKEIVLCITNNEEELHKNKDHVESHLNDEEFIETEILMEEYLIPLFHDFIERVKTNIGEIFTKQATVMLWVFIGYITLIIVFYFSLWQIFVQSFRKSLQVTQSLLFIIPAEIVFKVEKIKDYIISSTQTIILQ